MTCRWPRVLSIFLPAPPPAGEAAVGCDLACDTVSSAVYHQRLRGQVSQDEGGRVLHTFIGSIGSVVSSHFAFS